MNAQQLISDLKAQGISVGIEGERLSIRAPRGALNEDLRSQLKESKGEILAQLLKEQEQGMTSPLSAGQQMMWFIQQLAPESVAYNVNFVARAKNSSGLEPELLQLAWQDLAERHAVLRTTFPRQDGKPGQRIGKEGASPFEWEDATGWSEQQLETRLAKETSRPFDLESGPVTRLHLFRRSGDDSILLLTAHHIVLDLWSLVVLLEDLGQLYSARRRGVPAALPTIPAAYTDFVRQQAEMLSSSEGQQHWEYWRKQLGGELPFLNLPTDRPIPVVQTYHGGAHAFRLDAPRTLALKRLAQDSGMTLYSLLLAVFQLLLHRLSGQRDILVGSTVAGRGVAEFEKVVGYFTNAVALRGDFSNDPSAQDLFDQLQDKVLGAIEHQDFPFSVLVERLRPSRDPSRPPIFQVGFMLEQQTERKHEGVSLFVTGQAGGRMELGELTLESEPLDHGTAQYEMLLMVEELPGTLSMVLQYNRDLFDASSAMRMAGQLTTLLDAVSEDSERRVSQLPLLTAAEQHQVLQEWNGDVRELPEECFHQLFEHRADRAPAAVAAVFEGQWLSYGELNQRANQLAHRLCEASRPASGEMLVGLFVERSLEMLLGILGIWKAGAAYLPLDPTLPRQRLQLMLDDSEASLVLTQAALSDQLVLDLAPQINLDTEWPSIAQQSDANPQRRIHPEQLAYVIYTSGSTGKPKGTLLTHGGLRNLADAFVLPMRLTPEARILQFATMSFDATIAELAMMVRSGGSFCLAAKESLLPGSGLAELLDRLRNTAAILSPPVLAHLETAGLSGLRTLMSAGEALNRELVEIWAPGRDFWNGYGPTETTVCATFRRCHPGPRQPDIGRPIGNFQVHLLSQRLVEVPVGVAGEICVSSPGLARGYLARAGRTAESFVPDPFSSEPGGRLYRTGDLGAYRRSGNIDYLGRVDHQVKVRGCRVEIGEVEAALLGHPKVREALVMPRSRNDGDSWLVAYAVPEPGGDKPAAAELRNELQRQLPDYMVPSRVIFLDRFPTTSAGKVDRRALPEPERAPERASTPAAPVASELEKVIAELWCQVLELPEVGLEDNFFELGGHSLLMTRLHVELRKIRPVSIVDLFTYPTVRSLAKFLDRAGVAAPALVSKALQEVDSEIAIIGMSGRFPGARDVAEFWQNLVAGRETVTRAPDPLGAASGGMRAGGLLDDIEQFDAEFFGINPREAELMDPQHRVFLEVAWEALERAGYDPGEYAGEVGVFAGAGINHYLLVNVLGRLGVGAAQDFHTMIGNDATFLPTRVSYKLNLRGPSLNVQTACSTSLVAASLACKSLVDGQCDMALAGGVAIRVPQDFGSDQTGWILSSDGRCRAFDAAAQGTVAGNGAGVVVLKRLRDAVADGDHIHAVIRGWAVNNDGSLKAGYTAPSVEGQARVIAEAQRMSDFDPKSIAYIEAHGSGTALGDPIEVAALERVAAHAAGNGYRCAIGSVKTNIGHLDTAAGVASLIKTALALEHARLPASLNFETPNPQIDFENNPFYVNAELSEWPVEGVRRAGVSAFGIGGTNAHLVLEEAPEPSSGPSRPWQLLTLSARTESALEAATSRLAEHLEEHSELPLADVAYTAQVGRRAFAHRRTLVCRDLDDARQALQQRDPRRLLSSETRALERTVTFLFPGIGEQYEDMGAGLYRSEPVFRQRVDRCAELLRDDLGCDLREILYLPEGATDESAEKETLNLRAMLRRGGEKNLSERAGRLKTIPQLHAAIFVTEYALAGLWLEWGVRPQSMIGYSLGEYVAACVAGVIRLEDVLSLVVRRGQMIEELPVGAMLAVPLPSEEVKSRLGDELSIAAINGPALCVVSGPSAAVEAFEKGLSEEGVVSSRLASTRAFHSQMMEAIFEPCRELIATLDLQPPEIPYVSNVTGTWIEAEQATDPAYWATQMCKPVLFDEGLGEILRQPNPLLLEVGPGRTLTSFAVQHPANGAQDQGDGGASAVFVSSLRHAYERQDDQKVLIDKLGEVWLAGAEVDWSVFYQGEERRRVVLPTYPFERQRYWIEPLEGSGQPAQPAAPSKKSDLADWFYAPEWRLADPLPEAVPAVARWLLLVDESGLGEGLAESLVRQGHSVVRVRAGDAFRRFADGTYSLVPGRAEEFDQLLADLAKRDELPDRVVHLWSLDEAVPEDSKAALEAGFFSLVFLARALGHHAPAREMMIHAVANQLHDVVASDALSPEKAMLLAPCRVMPQEYTNLQCRSLDLGALHEGSDLSAQVPRLLAEFTTSGEELAAAWRGTERWVQVYDPVRLQPVDESRSAEEIRVRADGVYLLTGGTGRIALALSQSLARRGPVRLALVARRALPPRQEWPAWLTEHGEDEPTSRKIRGIESLEELGAEVLLLAADVSDEEEMRAAVDRAVDHFGALHGVIHAAGVVGPETFCPIAELDVPGAALHFRPKVDGLRVLRRVLAGQKLDFVILTSSLSPLLGGLGFSAYAAANLFMDTTARKLHHRGEPWVSVNWADWQLETAEAPDEETGLASLGATLAALTITPSEGAETFRRILAHPELSQVVVSSGDLEARFDQWVRRKSEPTVEQAVAVVESEPGARHARPNLANAYVAPSNSVEQTIAEIWCQLLGISEVGIHDNFFQVGGHSLVGTQLVTQLRSSFGVDLPLRALFEAPTVADLAALVGEADAGGHDETAVDSLPTLTPDRERRFEPFPLTDIQQAYWIGRSEDFALGNIASHGYLELERPELDIERFRTAWQRVIERHDMLRAVFLSDGTQQVRAALPGFDIPLVDLREQGAQAAEAHLQETRREMSHQVLPVDTGPLFEMRVSRLATERYRLHFSFDLLIGDVRSLEVLFRDLMAFYEDPQVEMEPLELSFRDCVLAEAALHDSEAYRAARDYWTSRLTELPPAPELPLAKDPQALDEPRFERHAARLDAKTWETLRQRAADFGITPAGLLLAAFAEVLGRFSRRPRFTLNLTLFNRLPFHPQVDEVVGDFTSLNMLEVDGSVPGSFKSRARRLQERLWEDLDHRLWSGVRVLRELSRQEGGASRSMMPVVFTSNLLHDNREAGQGLLAGLGEEVYSISQTPQVWLDHQVTEKAGSLFLIWDSLAGLFPEGLLDELCAVQHRFLEQLAQDDQAWLQEFPDLLPTAQKTLRAEVNATEGPVSEALLHTLFAEQAAAEPGRLAVISPRRTLTYGELQGLAHHQAMALHRAGVQPGELVAVVMEKGWEQVVAVLAILYTGAAYLPIDPELPTERRDYLLERGGVRVALTQPNWEGALEWPEGVQRLVVEDLPVSELDGPPSAPVQAPGDLAYVIFTSGSTGLPKGVMIDHRGAVNTVLDINRRFEVGPEDRVLALSALNFDLSVYDVFGILAAGAALVLPSPEQTREPAHWAELVAQQRVTLWNTVPALMAVMTDYWSAQEETPPPSLRQVMMSGDWIPVGLPEQLRGLGSKARLTSLGGATEASIWSIFYPIGEVDPAWSSIPYGRPLTNQSFHVLNDALEPCPDWVPGHLFIAGIGVAMGYLGDEEKTRASFFEHPRTGVRLYRTGDLGRYLPNGDIEFLGREDFQVKIQGYRIELGEIEATLGHHPSVHQAVVEARGRDRTNRSLVAYIVGAPGEHPTRDDLSSFLRERLPSYMVPAAFVFLASLPLSANGKVDRSALPEPSDAPRAIEVVAEERPVVARLAALVAEVLGVDTVDPQVNLLQLGATSLDLIRINNAIGKEFSVRPRLQELYLNPTVAAWVEAVEPSSEAAEEVAQLPSAEEQVDGSPQSLAASYRMILEPEERSVFKEQQHGLRSFENGMRSWNLGAPEESEEERQARFIDRRSHRWFAQESIPAEAFGSFLSCLRQITVDGQPKYLYGSAGGLWPVQTYLHLKPGSVDTLASGTYYYHPAEHKLVLLSPDAEVPAEVHSPFANRPIYERASFSIFLVADLGAVAPMYGERGYHFAVLEAGLMTQLLETTAPRSKIGLCQIGVMDFDSIRDLFVLDERHVLVHSLLGGHEVAEQEAGREGEESSPDPLPWQPDAEEREDFVL